MNFGNLCTVSTCADKYKLPSPIVIHFLVSKLVDCNKKTIRIMNAVHVYTCIYVKIHKIVRIPTISGCKGRESMGVGGMERKGDETQTKT